MQAQSQRAISTGISVCGKFMIRIPVSSSSAFWRLRKDDFENLAQWWEVGKTQIRIFCQPNTKPTVALERISAEQLERGINILEDETVAGNDGNTKELREWEKSSR